jgi:hypothetical protein
MNTKAGARDLNKFIKGHFTNPFMKCPGGFMKFPRGFMKTPRDFMKFPGGFKWTETTSPHSRNTNSSPSRHDARRQAKLPEYPGHRFQFDSLTPRRGRERVDA